MGGVIDGDIAIYKDFEVIVEDKHNFMLRHKSDDTRQIQITMRENANGTFDWVGLPACLKLQMNVFSKEEVANYPATLLKVVLG